MSIWALEEMRDWLQEFHYSSAKRFERSNYDTRDEKWLNKSSLIVLTAFPPALIALFKSYTAKQIATRFSLLNNPLVDIV